MNKPSKVLFSEEQRFRNHPLIILVFAVLLAVIGLQVFGLYSQLILKKPWGEHPGSDDTLLITSVAVIVSVIIFALMFVSLRLITEVREDGLYFRFPLLINKWRSIGCNDIERFEAGKYRPVRDFGGWGIRVKPFRSKAYSVRGNQALKLYLKNGKKVFFGTQDPDGIRRAMEKMFQSTNRI